MLLWAVSSPLPGTDLSRPCPFLLRLCICPGLGEPGRTWVASRILWAVPSPTGHMAWAEQGGGSLPGALPRGSSSLAPWPPLPWTSGGVPPAQVGEDPQRCLWGLGRKMSFTATEWGRVREQGRRPADSLCLQRSPAPGGGSGHSVTSAGSRLLLSAFSVSSLFKCVTSELWKQFQRRGPQNI